MPLPSWDDARRLQRVVQAAEGGQFAPQSPLQAGAVYGGGQALFKVRVTSDPVTTSAQGARYYSAFVLSNDPSCGEWIDHYQCWFVEPNQRAVAAGIYLAQETGSYLGVPAFVRDVPAPAGDSDGDGIGTHEIWCNCTVSGTTLTLQDQEDVAFVVVLAAGHYLIVFAVDFLSAESFEWSGSCAGAAAFLYETFRTPYSVTVKTSNGLHVERFGIDARGHLGTPASGGSGSGASGSGAGGGDYPTGGDPTCAAAAAATPLTLGATYGPFSIAFPAQQWFRFPVAIDTFYHTTLTRISGDALGGTGGEGTCGDLSLFITISEGCSSSPQDAAADGFVSFFISTVGASVYTIKVEAGVCP